MSTELSRLFTIASKRWRAATDEAMSRHGVRVGQNLLLEVLWQTDGLTPGELADHLGVATPTVVKSAQRMIAAGLLTKVHDQSDRRLVRVYLTDHARGIQQAITDARAEVEARATAELTAAEREHLASALAKIIQAFDPAGARPPGPSGSASAPP
jgi:MarR family transcriptional regulator, organic hydroperoxide resistance regulator